MASRREILLVLGVAALLAAPLPLTACPFCTMQGKTLTQEVEQATLVLYGKLTSASEKDETTVMEVEQVVKDDASRDKTRKTVTLARYIDPDLPGGGDKYRYLVFCDLFKGKLDPYRGLVVKKDSSLPNYLRGAVGLKDKSQTKRLRFFFDYLDNPDVEMSNDAYKEFGNADYADMRVLAKDLPAARIIKWLKDRENTPSFRIGLYASMLGHCGKKKDAAVLRELLDDPDRRAGSGIDGLLAAYTMLNPKPGWQYLQAALKNTKEEFMFRYAALRAVRFLHDYRPDVIGKKELVEAVCALLRQEDIADLAIEDLRKWKCWDRIDDVLAVRKTAAYKLPIVKRAILRFCLQCEGKPAAAAYVAERTKADAESVSEARELLELERATTKPNAKAPARSDSRTGR
jgi:hypothetical protein